MRGYVLAALFPRKAAWIGDPLPIPKIASLTFYAGFLDQAVSCVVLEVKALAVLVEQGLQAVGGVVGQLYLAAFGVLPGGELAAHVVRKAGDAAQGVAGADQAASRVPAVALVRTIGQGLGAQLAQRVVREFADLAQRIGDACQVAPAVVGVVGALARAVGVLHQQGALVPAQAAGRAGCSPQWEKEFLRNEGKQAMLPRCAELDSHLEAYLRYGCCTSKFRLPCDLIEMPSQFRYSCLIFFNSFSKMAMF